MSMATRSHSPVTGAARAVPGTSGEGAAILGGPPAGGDVTHTDSAFAGVVESTAGAVIVFRADGSSGPLRLGDTVSQGDSIETGPPWGRRRGVFQWNRHRARRRQPPGHRGDP